MAESDLGAVLALERKSEAAPHWSEAEYLLCIHPDKYSPLKRSAMVADLDGEVAGFAIIRVVRGPGEPDAELESIIVGPEWRGRGLGMSLLSEAGSRAREWEAIRLDLEVRASNTAAIGLYRKAGFVETGRRRGYYGDQEDAVLMSVTL